MKWLLIALGGLVVLSLVVVIVGRFLPEAHVAATSVRLRQPPDTVWATIRSFGDYPSWWPSVKSAERLSDRDGHEVWNQRQRTGDLPLEIIDEMPPHRLVTRIADERLPFGGTWTYEVVETDEGSRVTITERGEIYNPFFRVMARLVFGYHRTQEGYLEALAAKFGEPAQLERVE